MPDPRIPPGPIEQEPTPLFLPVEDRAGLAHQVLADLRLDAWDRRIVHWLASGTDTSTLLTILSLIERAKAGQVGWQRPGLPPAQHHPGRRRHDAGPRPHSRAGRQQRPAGAFHRAEPGEDARLLRDKLLEEAQQAAGASGPAELLEELGDLLQVLDAPASQASDSPAEIESARARKAHTPGSFTRRVVWHDPATREDGTHE